MSMVKTKAKANFQRKDSCLSLSGPVWGMAAGKERIWVGVRLCECDNGASFLCVHISAIARLHEPTSHTLNLKNKDDLPYTPLHFSLDNLSLQGFLASQPSCWHFHNLASWGKWYTRRRMLWCGAGEGSFGSTTGCSDGVLSSGGGGRNGEDSTYSGGDYNSEGVISISYSSGRETAWDD
jgi:hypothetical protein